MHIDNSSLENRRNCCRDIGVAVEGNFSFCARCHTVPERTREGNFSFCVWCHTAPERTRCARLVTRTVIRKHNCKAREVVLSYTSRGSRTEFWNFHCFPYVSLHFNFFFKLNLAKMGKKDKTEQSLFTKEEEQLLSDFSRVVSPKSSLMFYGCAFMVSLLPICKWRFQQ